MPSFLAHGFELLPEGVRHCFGVRWTAPRTSGAGQGRLRAAATATGITGDRYFGRDYVWLLASASMIGGM
jgi:hypothetical protein